MAGSRFTFIHPYFHRRSIFVKANSSRRKENRAPEPTINRFDEFYDDPRVFQRYSTRYFHASPPVRRSSRQCCYACAEQHGEGTAWSKEIVYPCVTVPCNAGIHVVVSFFFFLGYYALIVGSVLLSVSFNYVNGVIYIYTYLIYIYINISRISDYHLS